jgi:hypothetical protein
VWHLEYKVVLITANAQIKDAMHTNTHSATTNAEPDITTSVRLVLVSNRTYDYTRNYIYAASAFVAISSFILAMAAAGLSPLGQVLEHCLSVLVQRD